MTLGRSAYSPIGLDIGSHAIKAVQLVRARAGDRIHAAARIPRQARAAGGTLGPDLSPQEILRAVGVLRRQGFVGRCAVACVPPANLLSCVLDLPARTGAVPLDAIARQELARASKREPQSIELAWWDLPTPHSARGAGVTSPGAPAMAVGCAHADANALLDRLTPGAESDPRAALDIRALDAAPVALARACAPLAATAPELTAILDMGFDSARLLIVAGPTPVYERTLADAGSRLLAAAIITRLSGTHELADHVLHTVGCEPPGPAHGAQQAETLEGGDDARAIICAHADAVASELRTSIAYAARRFDAPLNLTLLTGGAADTPGLAHRLSQRAGVQVQVARADQLSPACEGWEGSPAVHGPGAVLALGLARHEMSGGDA